SFIKSLPLMEITKDSLYNDLYSNWLSEEWINCFIDGDNIIEEISSQFVFEAGQVTYWNSRIIEHQLLPFKQPMDMKRQLNQGQLYTLLHLVRPVEGGSDTYFYVKKGNSGFRSPYTMRKINIDNKSFELLQQMIDKLASKHP
ncbi:946_t:CDS:2, partial [Gigaspora margarita]